MAFVLPAKLYFFIMYDISQLNDMLVPELGKLQNASEISGFRRLAKQELIHKILDQQAVGAKKQPSPNCSRAGSS